MYELVVGAGFKQEDPKTKTVQTVLMVPTFVISASPLMTPDLCPADLCQADLYRSSVCPFDIVIAREVNPPDRNSSKSR